MGLSGIASLRCVMAAMIICVISVLLIPHASYAAGEVTDTAVCTVNQAGFDTEDFQIVANNIVSTIVGKIAEKLSEISMKLYENLILDGQYLVIIGWVLVLYITLYGILFTTGMVPISLNDFVIRLIKIGIIVWLIQPTSWKFFSDTVVTFFNRETNDIINYLTGTGVAAGSNLPIIGNTINSATTGATAFVTIDGALNKIISSKMFVTLMGSALTSVYGMFMSGLMLASILLFIRSLMTAMWVYIMSLVIKSLLFGLAPIFIPTILFHRTRHLFDNWLNQLLNASLQPILLFVFYVFFIKLMEGSLDNILQHPLCWTKFPEGFRGSAFDFYFWRFAEDRGPEGFIPDQREWKLTDGFPIPFIAILSFIMIAELANRFNNVVIQIAMQISQASVSLTSEGGPVSSMFGSLGSGMTRNRMVNSGIVN